MQLSLSNLTNLSQSSGRDEKFDYLTVRDKIIDMGDRSINITNIASVTVFKRRWSWIIKSIVALATLYFAVTAIASFSFFMLALPFLLLTIASAALLFWLFQGKWFLSISTSDGILSLFTSKDVAFLRQVKVALDEKMNGTGAQSNFTFNFGADSIKNVNIDRVDTIQKLSGETVISESPGSMFASNSPGAQVGLGATMTNTFTETTVNYIDYERFIPGVEQFRNYLAEKRPNAAVEAKLDEMLNLMRQGTASPTEKTRVRDLALELSQYVQAYQPLRDLFASIVNLVSQAI